MFIVIDYSTNKNIHNYSMIKNKNVLNYNASKNIDNYSASNIILNYIDIVSSFLCSSCQTLQPLHMVVISCPTVRMVKD